MSSTVFRKSSHLRSRCPCHRRVAGDGWLVAGLGAARAACVRRAVRVGCLRGVSGDRKEPGFAPAPYGQARSPGRPSCSLWTGPGNLWPIVLAFAAAISAAAVFSGAVFGLGANKLRRS